MSRISVENVKHVAHLARLAITDQEAEKFQKQLDAIVTFAEQLNELDTTDVKPTTHVLTMKMLCVKMYQKKVYQLKKY